MAPCRRTAAWLLALAGLAPHVGLAAADADVDADDGKPKEALSKSASRQIVAVVDTLNDIAASVQSEQVKETQLFKDFSAWCDKEKKNLASSLEDAQSQSESSDVGSKELSATVVSLETRLGEIQKAITETDKVMKQAEAIRKKESDTNNDDMTLNRQSLNQVEKAIKIVQKVHKPGLLQEQFQRYQISEPGESSYVMGIMKGLQEKLEKTRKNLEADEKKKVTMHSKFMSTKKGEMSNLQSEKVQKRNSLTESKINLVELKKILEQSSKKVVELKRIIKETADMCKTKSESFQLRAKEREQELEAIKEAIKTIKSQAAIAKQLPAKKKAALLEEEDDEAAIAFVQVEQHHRAAVRAVIAEATEQEKGPGNKGRNKAKGVVDKLIALLDKQQAEEADKLKYCKGELSKKGKEKTDVEDKLKALKAQIDAKGGEITNLQNEVSGMEKQIETQKKALAEAARLRKDAAAAYQSTSKDRKLAIKVLRQAMQVLKKFYASKDKTALLEKPKKKMVVKPIKRTKAPKTWSSGSTRKSIRSGTAVELMDKVAGEIAAEEKKYAAAEAKDAAAFEKLQADNRAEFDRLMQEITQRVKRKAKLVVQLNTNKEEQTQAKADLEAVSSQLVTLHKECDELIKNFDKRTKARGWEKNQLRDVIDILAGSSVAVRTGLVQAASQAAPRSDGAALDDTAAALLRDMAS